MKRWASVPVHLGVAASFCSTFSSAATKGTSSDGQHQRRREKPRLGVREKRTSPAPLGIDQGYSYGDDFGIGEARSPFHEPVRRSGFFTGYLDEVMHENQQPELCVNPDHFRAFKALHGLTEQQSYEILVGNDCDPNKAALELQELGLLSGRGVQPTRRGVRANEDPPLGPFGMVALEEYKPEAFGLLHVLVPNYEATKDEEVLDVVHELVMSAAELPMDVASRDMVDTFVNDWTVEDGTSVKELLREYNLVVKDVMTVPHGDYSAQGWFVANPVHEDYPNIGTAAGCCCTDFRTGIHKRFRFHSERICDSVAEHMVMEALHYGTKTHLLRQPYWFNPEYSVEDFIRLKEKLLVPSALIFEMRTGLMVHSSGGPGNFQPYRNLIEVEEIRNMQFKEQLDSPEVAAQNKGVTDDTIGGWGRVGGEETKATEGATQQQVYDDRVAEHFGPSAHADAFKNRWRRYERFYTNNTY